LYAINAPAATPATKPLARHMTCPAMWLMLCSGRGFRAATQLATGTRVGRRGPQVISSSAGCWSYVGTSSTSCQPFTRRLGRP